MVRSVINTNQNRVSLILTYKEAVNIQILTIYNLAYQKIMYVK